MVVKYKKSVTSFDVNYCSNLTYGEFETLCLGCSTFKLMQPKERIKKIKEVHGKLKAISGKTKKGRYIKDVSPDNGRKGTGDCRAESDTTFRGKEHSESKDNTEIQGREIRKEESED